MNFSGPKLKNFLEETFSAGFNFGFNFGLRLDASAVILFVKRMDIRFLLATGMNKAQTHQ